MPRSAGCEKMDPKVGTGADGEQSRLGRQISKVPKKRMSLKRLSSSYLSKLGRAMRKRGRRSPMLQMIFEGPHDEVEEQKVTAFRELLLAEGRPLGRYDDYNTLIRFLRMRAFDLQKAKETFIKMLNWRDSFGVDQLVKSFNFEEFEQVKKCYPHGFHGVDKYGRPLYIERIGMADLDALQRVTTIERFAKYHVVEQEKTLNLRFPACSFAAKKHIASTTAVLDVQGVGKNHFIKLARDIFLEIQRIDANYYPETLHKLFIINAGSGFKVLWKAVKAFLDPRTVAKIRVLGSKYMSELIEFIEPSNLPTSLNGNCICADSGGCLMQDKGPWTDPEVIHLLECLLERDQNLDDDRAENDTDADDIFENDGHPRVKAETSEHLSRKLLELETELKNMKILLQDILSSQGTLVGEVEELKALTASIRIDIV